jgi:hypothetical protein
MMVHFIYKRPLRSELLYFAILQFNHHCLADFVPAIENWKISWLKVSLKFLRGDIGSDKQIKVNNRTKIDREKRRVKQKEKRERWYVYTHVLSD